MPFDALPNIHQHTVETNSDLRLLRLARDLLKRGKWCQGGLQGPNDSRCAIGWLVEAYKATEYGPHEPIAVIPSRVADACRFGLGITPRQLAEFNDHPRTRKRHVLEAFEKAVWRLEDTA